MLQIQNTVALVVDIQERLIPAMNHAENFVGNTAKMMEGLNILSVPIAITEQYPKGLGATVAEIQAQRLETTPVFEKTLFSAYTDKIKTWLQQQNEVKNIILMGCETHVCVLQTALDLRAAGYQVYLPQECIASRTDANRENGTMQMAKAGVYISNIESILFMLLRDARHPNFKAISKLIV